MSQFPQDFENPYAATSLPAQRYAQSEAPLQPRLPGFCKVVFIFDLVFCILRLPLAALGVVGYFAMIQENPGDPLLATVIFEIVTGAGIVAFGITGNSLLLAQKSWGVYLGFLAVIFTIGSIAAGLWQLWLAMQPMPPKMQAAAMVGGAITLGIRLGINALVCIALVRFIHWRREQEPLTLAM